MAPPPPVFVFVLDTCMIEEEMGYVKSALRRAIGLVPENALVGFVSFGTQVQVHELGFSDMSKVYVFRGSKDITKDQILEQLGLGSSGGVSARRSVGGIGAGAGAGAAGYHKGGIPNGFPGSGVTRFLLPASDCEYTLNAVSFGILCLFEIDDWDFILMC